jgi:hypothetical protein
LRVPSLCSGDNIKDIYYVFVEKSGDPPCKTWLNKPGILHFEKKKLVMGAGVGQT